jgi:hypothetical protein
LRQLAAALRGEPRRLDLPVVSELPVVRDLPRPRLPGSLPELLGPWVPGVDADAAALRQLNQVVDQALQVELPASDPVRVGRAGWRCRRAAGEVEQAGDDLDRLRRDRLPQVRTGEVAEVAQRRMAATAARAQRAGEVLRRAAAGLDELSDGLGQARQRFSRARDQLAGTRAVANQAGVSAVGDYRRQCADRIDEMAAAYAHHEEVCARAAGLLRDCAGQATASGLDTTVLTSTQRLQLAGAADAMGAVLTASDSTRAAARLEEMSPPQRAEFQDLLDAAGSGLERAWITKALAVGHGVAALTGFAEAIRGRDQSWLQDRLRPLDPDRFDSPRRGGPNFNTWMGADLRQAAANTCGSLSLLVARAIHDPVYALELAAEDGMPERLAAEEQRILDETNQWRGRLGWPEGLGTWPAGAASYLSEHTGVAHEVTWDLTGSGPQQTMDNVADAVAGASAGNPSLLLIGDAYPDHYVMVIGHDDNGDVLVYNSWGNVATVPAAQLHREPFELSSAAWSSDVQARRIYAVISPTD